MIKQLVENLYIANVGVKLLGDSDSHVRKYSFIVRANDEQRALNFAEEIAKTAAIVEIEIVGANVKKLEAIYSEDS